MPGLAAAALRLRRRLRVSLERIARSPSAEHRLVQRARIVLMAGAGTASAEIARVVGVREATVRKWRRRVEARPQVTSLWDAPRSGRPERVPLERRCEVVSLACSMPADHLPKPAPGVWTRTLLAEAMRARTGETMSVSEIGRTLRSVGLRPYRVRMWLHSPDPDFRPKVERICALYTSPPRGATVLCIDEKTGMQALSRRYPTRFEEAARAVREEFEYRRHGTSTLIAAFDIRTGQVYGHLRRRTAAGLLAFMEGVATRYPKGDVYVVWDNLNIHHGPRWDEFNSRHGGRFHFVYTPLHASWVNQVEIWFSILARRVLKHVAFASKRELDEAVRGFLRQWNRAPRPFRWTFRGHFDPPALRLAA
jgi:transposase